MSRMIALLGLCLGLLSPLASADMIYKYRGKDGTVLFTDQGSDRVSRDDYILLSVRKGWEDRTSRKLTAAMRDQFDSTIRDAARTHRIQPELIKAVIHAESLFDEYAVSRVGAQGLMQLMPQTAAHLEVYNPFNARQNIMGGAQFLKYLMGKFDKLEHVLAAYNAGETNVRRYNGIPPFKETQGYVKKVLQLMPTYATHFAPKPESPDTLAANN